MSSSQEVNGESSTSLNSPPPSTSAGITSPTNPSRDSAGDSSKPSDFDSRGGDGGGGGGDDSRDRRGDGDSRTKDSAPSSREGGSTSGLGPRISHRQSARKVYVGNLASAATEKDVMDLFANSPVPCALPAQIDMKAGYAFVHFDETSGLDEAIPQLTGIEVLGMKVRVETSRATSSSTRCFTCGMEGHWSRDCPHARGGGGGGSSRYSSSASSYPSSSSRYPPSSSSRDPYSSSRRSDSPDYGRRRPSPPSRYGDSYARPRSPPRYGDRGASPGRDRYYEGGRDDRGGRSGYDRYGAGGGGGGGGAGGGGYYGGGGSGGYGSGGYGNGSSAAAYPPPPSSSAGYGGSAYPPPPSSGYGSQPPASRGGYY